MTERINERAWVNQVYGRDNSVANLSRKIAASIYLSAILRGPPHDHLLLEEIKTNLLKLIGDAELRHLEVLYNRQEERQV